MLFYEFFKRHLNTPVKITLKNEMVLSGVLKSIDPFLNMKIDSVKLGNEVHGLGSVSVCSVRGSAIKCVDLDRDPVLDKRLCEATFLKFSLDK